MERDELRKRFQEHVDEVGRRTAHALETAAAAGEAFDGIVFHAGALREYYADDREIWFRTSGHFARFAPVRGPHHLLAFRPGARPRLIHVIPADYWFEPPEVPDHPFGDVLDVTVVGSADEACDALGACAGWAYVGDDPATAERLGVDASSIDPRALLAALDWHRAEKTPYEVFCIEEATKLAVAGHRAAAQAFRRKATEREVSFEYLIASGQLAHEEPFGHIALWDRRASFLHGDRKETTPPPLGHVLLVDAGAAWWGYAADVTRTHVAEDAHPAFREARRLMAIRQRRLADRVAPGVDFVELHLDAHRAVSEILEAIGVLRIGADDAFERGLTRAFLGHGLGHHLGLQVHDVGGRQISIDGTQRPPPDGHEWLRTTRVLAPGHVVTIEPGIYFVPLLLDPIRVSDDADAIDWKLADELVECGGIRIEDDVLVTADGGRNLTREVMPE